MNLQNLADVNIRDVRRKISKGVIRILKKDYESKGAKRVLTTRWVVSCCVNLRNSLESFANGEEIPGLKSLTVKEQAMVKEKLSAMSSEESKRPANGTKEVSPIHKLKFNSEEPSHHESRANLYMTTRISYRKN